MARYQSHWPMGLAVAVLAVLHGAAAWQLRPLRPSLTILDPAPGPLARKAMAFGDDEFLYRDWILDLQNAGDTGGRATPMRDYDYGNVLSWLEALDMLDPRAQAHLYLAAHYFAQSQRPDQVRQMVVFVAAAAERMPELKWPWIAQAATLAEVHLNDLPYAIELSQRLVALHIPDMPLAFRLMPAVLMIKAGKRSEARAEIAEVVATAGESFSPYEKAWVNDLLQRLAP